MNSLRLTIFTLIVFVSTVQCQKNYYGLKLNKKSETKCKHCIDAITNKPKEVRIGIHVDELNNLFFIVDQKELYNKLIKKRKDGIAIDIVSKERYNCSNKNTNDSSIVRGDFLKPIYKRQLNKNIDYTQTGGVKVYIGKLPEEHRNEDIEINLLLINKKHWCYYTNFIDIQDFRWDLLDMGLYFDTLTYKNEFNSNSSKQADFILKHKKMRFEIMFKKNKSTYSTEDIKPLYDSLNLNDYDIKKINIRAYSSVEGSDENNNALQKKRVESIVNALQAYQKPTIETEIITTENWVDFLNDVLLTPYASMADLTKEEIKTKLKDKKTLRDLEPFLSKHRKAIIVLELQKKDYYEKYTTNELVNMFAKSIEEENLEQAINIQNSIFEKIKNTATPANLIDTLKIPQKEKYGVLLTKNSSFKYFMNERELFNTYKELMELQDLLPNDGHIKYNICAIKFKIWLLGTSSFNPEEFKKEILDLKKYGIPVHLIKRMLINYEIIMCEYYMIKGDFENKDKSLKYISSNYKSIPMSDADLLSLAQYYVSYAKYEWATKLIEKKVSNPNVDEDLLFYYINLTIADDKLTKRGNYKAIMLNAINLNKTRYCKLFDTRGENGNGGISFQLLENERLKKMYCDNCK
jgi:outer membrane protein OmpA-like peptidoglycan-associated protein